MDAAGLAHFCGTNTTFFVPALRDCCGFVTGLLSEDTPTGAELNKLGWDNLFLDQALAVGTVSSHGEQLSRLKPLIFSQLCNSTFHGPFCT